MFKTSRKNLHPQPYNPLKKLHQHLVWGMVISAGLLMISIASVVLGT